jgi:hypothetical protein
MQTPDREGVKGRRPFSSPLEVTGTCDDALAFQNQDGTCLLLIRNGMSDRQLVEVDIGNHAAALELPGNCVGTFSMKPA